MTLTLATAFLLPAIVFAYLAATTSHWVPSQRQLTTWRIGKKVFRDTGGGITVSVGKEQIYLHSITMHTTYSSFSFELYFRDAIVPDVMLYYRNTLRDSDQESWHRINLSSQIRFSRRNNISVSVDQALGLQKANEFMLSFISPRDPIFLRVSNAHVESFSFLERCRQMLASLFEWQPLTHRHNNLILSQKVGGRGFTFLLWAALPWCLIVLLVRRFVFRQSFPLVVHAAITVLVCFVMIDLRNNVDYFRHARLAATRYAQSQDLYAYLYDLYWDDLKFSETVRYLKEELPPDSPYYINFGKAWKTALKHICYYARPARRVEKIEEADVALLLGASAVDSMSDRFQEWTRKTTLPNRVVVFERRK